MNKWMVDTAVAPAAFHGLTQIPQSVWFKPVGKVVADLSRKRGKRREYQKNLPDSWPDRASLADGDM